MCTLDLEVSGGGIVLKNLYFNEFETELTFHQYCVLVYNYKKVLSHYRSIIDADIESVEIIIDGSTVLLLEKDQELGRFLSEFHRISNDFLSDQKNALRIFHELMEIRSAKRIHNVSFLNRKS